jgi:hypothetical protein
MVIKRQLREVAYLSVAKSDVFIRTPEYSAAVGKHPCIV